MHSMKITHENPNGDQQVPEVFNVHHNGDWSGNIEIMLGNWRVTASGQNAYRAEIPFRVLLQIVASAVRDRRIAELEQMDDAAVLGMGR